MTAPTPNAELAYRVRARLIGFDWSNYGLDFMEDAQPDWAEDLADRIIVEIFGQKPYGSGCSCDYLGEGTPEHTPGAFCPKPGEERTDEPDVPPLAPSAFVMVVGVPGGEVS